MRAANFIVWAILATLPLGTVLALCWRWYQIRVAKRRVAAGWRPMVRRAVEAGFEPMAVRVSLGGHELGTAKDFKVHVDRPRRMVGVDPGQGSDATGIVLCERHTDGTVTFEDEKRNQTDYLARYRARALCTACNWQGRNTHPLPPHTCGWR